MAVRPATFMLLPDFTHLPDDSLHLGTLLLLSPDTKLPDPDIPLNATTRVAVDEKDLKRSTETSWHFERGKQWSGFGSLDLELSVFSPVGGSVGYGRSNTEDVNISCDQLETQRFVPTNAYLSNALKDGEVKLYCRQNYFPSVYMITGIKVAYNAEFTHQHTKEITGNASAKVDTTVVGVPLNVGHSGEGLRGTTGKQVSKVAGPFILAYQLKRLRLKRDGSLKKAEAYNTHALMDDTDKRLDNTSPETLEEYWDVEDVIATTEHTD